MTQQAPVLAFTPGEPAGIGPECAVRLADAQPDLRLLMVADPEMLNRTAQRLGTDLRFTHWRPGDRVEAGRPACLPVPLVTDAIPGVLDPSNAGYVLDTLRAAVGLLHAGHASALVTGPVHKGVINDAGVAFTGHTEFLAGLAGVRRVVMMLAAGDLRVALVTTHLPLREVPDNITRSRVAEILGITHKALRENFAIDDPAIQVLGLNPHAGEGGHLGHEDEAEIRPAVEAAREAGWKVVGPVPADTAFTRSALSRCDAVVAMYHDQGLPVLKHAGFGESVNITLGLPYVRTSVDHGTALDIAGRGRADASSAVAAARLAAELSVASTSVNRGEAES